MAMFPFCIILPTFTIPADYSRPHPSSYILLICRISSFMRRTTLSGPMIRTPFPSAMIQPRN